MPELLAINHMWIANNQPHYGTARFKKCKQLFE
jgi:hypothetical protein